MIIVFFNFDSNIAIIKKYRIFNAIALLFLNILWIEQIYFQITLYNNEKEKNKNSLNSIKKMITSILVV